MRYHLLLTLAFLLSAGIAQAQTASDGDTPIFQLVLKDHAFVPPQLTIPADTRIKLLIKNQDASAAEFESEDFQAEKIVPANGEVSLFIAPLKAGSYGFYDDFHEDDTKGKLIAQ